MCLLVFDIEAHARPHVFLPAFSTILPLERPPGAASTVVARSGATFLPGFAVFGIGRAKGVVFCQRHHSLPNRIVVNILADRDELFSVPDPFIRKATLTNFSPTAKLCSCP